MMSFIAVCAVVISMHVERNNGIGQFKPIFQVGPWEETLSNVSILYFSVISYLIDCSTTLEVFTHRNFVADFVRLKLNFIPKN